MASNISFIQNNLDLAKQKAASEGKLILVDFWAHWCSPCTWMDEHTFSDKRLSDYLNENYISVRVDIDNLEGYAHKEAYNIRYLPSLVILNEKGEIIKKYEESFAPSKLLTILKDHNKGGYNSHYYSSASTNTYQPSNPVQTEVQDAPQYRPALSTDYSTPSNTSTYTPSTTTTTTPSYEAPSTTVTTEDYMVSSPSVAPSVSPPVTKPAVTSTYTPSSPTSTAGETLVSTPTTVDYSANGTYEFSVKPAPKNGYSVQVGAYYEYGNVLREVAAFQKEFIDVVFVHISTLNGANCYKVLLGHFGTHESASQHKAFLRERGLDCFVKELSKM